ncbi:MAG: hypothetical protein V3V95_01820, partial [Thermodesulfobacteriota bacterium]
MRRANLIRFFILAVLLMALPSCAGYRVAGRVVNEADGSSEIVLPGDVDSITIPVFINNTKKPNVE